MIGKLGNTAVLPRTNNVSLSKVGFKSSEKPEGFIEKENYDDIPRILTEQLEASKKNDAKHSEIGGEIRTQARISNLNFRIGIFDKYKEDGEKIKEKADKLNYYISHPDALEKDAKTTEKNAIAHEKAIKPFIKPFNKLKQTRENLLKELYG